MAVTLDATLKLVDYHTAEITIGSQRCLVRLGPGWCAIHTRWESIRERVAELEVAASDAKIHAGRG